MEELIGYRDKSYISPVCGHVIFWGAVVMVAAGVEELTVIADLDICSTVVGVGTSPAFPKASLGFKAIRITVVHVEILA